MKTQLLNLIFLLFTISFSYSQSNDSKNQWSKLTNGSETERIEAAKQLSLYYQSESIDTLRIVGETIFFYGIDNHYQPAIEFGKITLAEFYVMNGRINDGIVMAKATLSNLQERGDLGLLSNVSRIISSGYRKLEDGNSAMLWAKKAIEYNKGNKESIDKTEGMISLAEAFLLQKKESKAIETYQDYISIATKSKNFRGLSSAYSRLGDIYRISGKLDLSESYFKKSFQMAKKTNLTSPKAHALNNLAIIYFEKGDTLNARLSFEKALTLREAVNDLKSISESYYNLGDYHFYIEQYSKALFWYKKSAEIARRNHLLKEEKDALLASANVYKKQSESVQEILCLEKVIALGNDIKLTQNADAEDLTNLQHEIWKTDFEQTKTKEIQKENSLKFYILLIISCSLAIALILVLVKLKKMKKSTN
ncbi:tetratricopeptide repeat protein [Fluviicola taffensis]|nr:tetratricopeptide repeat protein [Fluviicola taffensis]